MPPGRAAGAGAAAGEAARLGAGLGAGLVWAARGEAPSTVSAKAARRLERRIRVLEGGGQGWRRTMPQGAEGDKQGGPR
ncbi:MAG: hypothetical protein NVSMB18_36260 [Acetobacteraceae bacterium]